MPEFKLNEYHLKIFQKKKYNELIKEIETSVSFEKMDSETLSVLGICKIAKTKKTINDIKNAIQCFKVSYLKNKTSLSGLKGLINFINATVQFKKIENAKLNFDIAKKFFLEAKKNFGYNEELYLGISLIYKYSINIPESLKILKEIIENKSNDKSVFKSYVYNNNFTYEWNQKDYFEFSKKFKKIIPKIKLPKIDFKKNNKIKIGFISSDLRGNHSITYFLEKTLKLVDKDKIQLFSFSNLEKNKKDLTTTKFEKLFDKFYDTNELNIEQLASFINSKKIDILIDLMGFTGESRIELFNSRISKIQIVWLGYCNTVGLDCVDYLISDENLIFKSEEKYYAEKIIKLKDIWSCHSGIDIERKYNLLPAKKNKYITFGSFNNFFKISESNIDTWSNILKSVENSKLILKSSLKNLIDYDLKNKFLDKGVLDSIIFLNRTEGIKDHLNLYKEIDLSLDTFPYNGVTTSFESLWMNVPVLSLKGHNFNSRCGQSINVNAGLNHFVAKNPQEYVEKAILYSENLKKLEDERKHIFENILNTPLFNSKKFAKNFWNAILDLL